MKIADIRVGGRYIAKVSGVLTTVRVLAIREMPPAFHSPSGRWGHRIDLVNERTGRKITFSSAARLRRPVGPPSIDRPAPRAPAAPVFDERDCSGVFDGNQVISDADPGL